MKILPKLSNYSMSDIGMVTVEVDLDQEDKQVLYRTTLASSITPVIQKEVQQSLKLSCTDNKESTLSIQLKIKRCSEGSRWGRICCGELGMGWSLLFVEWTLVEKDAENDGTLIGPEVVQCRNSGAIGFVDVCESDYGEKSVQRMAQEEVPAGISKAIRGAFSNAKTK
jgi:hypothetical protein